VRCWLWNIFCVASLLVLVLSVTIWVRSWFVGEVICWASAPADWRSGAWSYSIASGRGAIGIRRMRWKEAGGSWEPGLHYLRDEPISPIFPNTYPALWNVRFGGFQWLYGVRTYPQNWFSYQNLVLPLWLFLPTTIPPILWWRRWWRRHARGFPVAAKEQ
jgi:hypothetical protein